MAKTVRMADMSIYIAGLVFQTLNGKDKVRFVRTPTLGEVIVTDIEPRDLIYPKGWYYAKGTFRNKHNTSNGTYSEAYLLKSNGDFWRETANYCTQED